MVKLPFAAKTKAANHERSQSELVNQFGPKIVESFHRISLVELFPNLRAWRERFPGELHKISVGVLDEYLASSGWFVTAEDGVYDVVCPQLPRSLAEIKYTAIRHDIENRLLERFDGVSAKSKTHLSSEIRQQDLPALRNGSRPLIELTLDLSEIVYRRPDNDPSFSKRITKEVKYILNRALLLQGFYVYPPNGKILLVFPESSRGFARIKRDDIVQEITEHLKIRHDGAGPPATKGRGTSPKGGPGQGPVAFRTRPVSPRSRRLSTVEPPRRDSFDPEAARVMPEGWAWSYQPLWRVRNRLLTAYVLRGFPPANEIYKAPAGNSSLKELPIRTDMPGPADLALLDIAVHDLVRSANRGRQAIVIVPVRFATLDRTNLRTLYVQICSQMPEQARKYLVLEIVGVPQDLAFFRLEERVKQIKAFSRTILMRAGLSHHRFQEWSRLDLHAVGMDMGQYVGPEIEIMHSLEQFAEAAEKNGLHTYAYGIPSLSLTTATVASGIEYIGGDLIAPPTRDPLRVAEFDTTMLYPRGEASKKE